MFAFPFDFWDSIEIGATHTWFDDYVAERLSRYPKSVLRKLDIWDEDFVKYYHLQDPRRKLDRLIHTYLHRTNPNRHTMPIRMFDKILRMVYK